MLRTIGSQLHCNGSSPDYQVLAAVVSGTETQMFSKDKLEVVAFCCDQLEWLTGKKRLEKAAAAVEIAEQSTGSALSVEEEGRSHTHSVSLRKEEAKVSSALLCNAS